MFGWLWKPGLGICKFQFGVVFQKSSKKFYKKGCCFFFGAFLKTGGFTKVKKIFFCFIALGLKNSKFWDGIFVEKLQRFGNLGGVLGKCHEIDHFRGCIIEEKNPKFWLDWFDKGKQIYWVVFPKTGWRFSEKFKPFFWVYGSKIFGREFCHCKMPVACL